MKTRLLADDLYQRSLSPPSIELAVEDLFPRTEIELVIRNRDHDFAAHHLPFQMRVGIIFASAVVTVLRGRLMRRDFSSHTS